MVTSGKIVEIDLLADPEVLRRLDQSILSAEALRLCG
jgi:hypothetical protein